MGTNNFLKFATENILSIVILTDVFILATFNIYGIV